MRDLKNVYRRYALSFATSSMAICIGFVMQTSEAAVLTDEKSEAVSTRGARVNVPSHLMPATLSEDIALPAMPQERGFGVALPGAPVLVAVADDLPVGILPAEEIAPKLRCRPVMEATPSAGALIDLSLFSDCHAGEQVSITHENLQFQALVPEQGLLRLSVPALAENAVVAAEFGNGDRVTTTTLVESLSFYDRILVQWRNFDGPELHAREFAAEYGSEGHVWREAARDVAALAGGRGGFLMRLGASDLPFTSTAEVYTFPTGIASKSGDVLISVEAEVTENNCGRQIVIQSSSLRQGQASDEHELTMQMPDCSAVGEFLLLKNLVKDLTIARK